MQLMKAQTGTKSRQSFDLPRPAGDQKLAASVGALMWLTGSCTTLLGSYLFPSLIDNGGNARVWISIVSISTLVGIAIAMAVAPNRLRYGFLVFGAFANTLINVLIFYAGPDAAGAVMFNLLIVVGWSAYFTRTREFIAIATFNSFAALTPLFFDPQASASTHLASRLAVFIPVFWTVGTIVHLFTISRIAAMADVEREATTDPLTGLANLRRFHERAEELFAGRRPVGVLLIDLDNFKRANTLHGHAGGDMVLREVGRQIEAATAAEQLVARIGGDEFGLVTACASVDELRDIAGSIRAAVRRASRSVGLPGVDVDASIGIAISPTDGKTLDDLLTTADRGMYEVKREHHEKRPEPKAAGQPQHERSLVPTVQDSKKVSEPPARPRFRNATRLLRRVGVAIGWYDKPLHTRWRTASWAIGLACMGVALAMPDAYREHLAATMVLALVGAVYAIVNYLTASGLDSAQHRASDVAGLVLIGLAAWATGGITSPIWPLLLVYLSYTAWFLDARGLWLRMPAALLLTCTPLIYEPVFGAPDADVLLVTLYSSLSAVVVITVVLAYNRYALDLVQRRLALIASTDPLTGLPNRREFENVVEAALAKADDRPIAIVMIDLDNFKEVNTRHGHLEGDVLLAQIADKLRSAARAEDCLARLGGDEFAAILTGVDTNAARQLSERFVGAVAEVSRDSGSSIGMTVGASAGWAIRPDDGTTLDELLMSADAALDSIKRSGKGRAGATVRAAEAV
jgi:diguanylate cyclase (GGDEF)-like protein